MEFFKKILGPRSPKKEVVSSILNESNEDEIYAGAMDILGGRQAFEALKPFVQKCFLFTIDDNMEEYVVITERDGKFSKYKTPKNPASDEYFEVFLDDVKFTDNPK